MSVNINGFCPHCNANLDGDLVVDTLEKQYEDPQKALDAASHYVGWKQHGEANRWGRQIGIYDMNRDMTTKYRCPDCEQEWDR